MAWFGASLGTTFAGQWWGDQQAAIPPAGGARPAGGWYDNTGWESLFLRPVRDERERIEAVAEVVADAPVEWSGAVPVFARPPEIDWGVARKIEARAEAYDDSAMLDAMRRVIEAARRAQDEEDVAVLITLIH